MSMDIERLREAHDAARRVYRERGFQARIGYGTRPALVNVDLANAWTRKGGPFECDGVDDMLLHVGRLLEVARPKRVPVVFTTTAYEADLKDAEPWIRKIPALSVLKLGSPACEIDERVAPRAGEIVLVKKMASAFAGTHLGPMLHALGVDTVIVTGTTACACVRHTVEDALALGFRPIVPREAVGDRVPGAVEANLFDIDAKFGDVEPVERVLAYLRETASFARRGGDESCSGR
jgi:N-carbamoylsarcosine amidase